MNIIFFKIKNHEFKRVSKIFAIQWKTKLLKKKLILNINWLFQ
jgi:hypothetical protein